MDNRPDRESLLPIGSIKKKKVTAGYSIHGIETVMPFRHASPA
jgi:hypothetical protein